MTDVRGQLPLDVCLLRACVNYDPIAGIFTWLERPASTFLLPSFRSAEDRASCFNARFAGQPAFATLQDEDRPYLAGAINAITYKAHRAAWAISYGVDLFDNIDHIDGDGANNRLKNLRVAPDAVNAKNKARYRNNASGFPGVSWDRKASKWRAYVALDGRRRHLGFFEHVQDAAQARLTAAVPAGYHPNHGRHA